ncbi:MAG: FtsW/RodA/SpoVE family cell cycle protein [Prevotellaceae bacterium]|jgi:cell division protein FtsW|nr:FtsW/RodA/SpoVE family cell cycle protein [Prevotellaceae bacterium]
MKLAFWNSVKGDKVIWRIVLILSFMSILLVYSSTPTLVVRYNYSIFYFLLEQSVYVGLGLFLVYLFHNIPVGLYRRLAIVALVFCILLLLLTLIFPAPISIEKNAYRWYKIPLIGISIQTSDVAKIGLIIYLAKVLENNNLDTFMQVALKALLPIVIVCSLIMYGNFSTGLLIGITSLCIMFIGGIKKRFIAYMLGILVGLATLVVIIGLEFPSAIPRATTAVNRVTRFINDDDVSSEDNFQAEQAKIAVASGGIIGLGPGNSTQRYILPEAHSDFVYAIVAEEYGFIGALVFLLLYLWLLFRAVLIAKKCTRIFPMIVVLGFMLIIVFQAMINMGVSVGVFPVTGQTLPLVSKGGTSMVFMSVAFGIILAISRTADEKMIKDKGQPATEN